MKVEDYPTVTVIIRGYTYSLAKRVIGLLSEYQHRFAVEVTTNTPDYLNIIADSTKSFGDRIDVGAGTITDVGQAKEAVNAGAKFLLGPGTFDEPIFRIAKASSVVTIPGAMTPSEVIDMMRQGADIVKVFPAVIVGPDFFRQLRGPLGNKRLMAVGGINSDNGSDFLLDSSCYLGVGSNFFNKKDLKTWNEDGLRASIEKFVEIASHVSAK